MLAAFLGITVWASFRVSPLPSVWRFWTSCARAWDPYRTDLMDVPGALILHFDAPLFFGNGALLGSFVRDELDEAADGTERVVLAAEPVTGIDTTALDGRMGMRRATVICRSSTISSSGREGFRPGCPGDRRY
jgi:hypothetical protein